MLRKFYIIVLVAIITTAFTIPDKVEKKADKTISKYFGTVDFLKETILIPEEIDSNLPSEFGQGNLFRIISEGNLLAYGYIGTAPSKTADFDYLILFDSEFIIIKSKVLIYREEYGGEIGSKRWLKQFTGESIHSSELVYGDDIIPISGATISVRSMTNAINDLLKSLVELQDLNLI